ncbi:SWPV1-295 [Shearwaterpox virus]|uniref:SWPV1-295 n=1 Tax=Shearwaterpox virus TaxID=1974596 RepID=A0A1V0S8A5_CNPV|nr:SWPV1-295 [Shearwaterpox virus]
MDYEEHGNETYYYDADTSPMRVFPSTAAKVITMSIYIISFIVGIIGNGIVIWLAGFKWQRSITGLLFLHLAIADFILVMFLPIELSYLVNNYHWSFGLAMCKISSFAYHVGSLASVFFLTVISLYRYCYIYKQELCYKYKYRYRPYAITLIAALWTLAIILATTRTYSKTIQEIIDGIDCIDDFHRDIHTSVLLYRIVMSLFLIIGYIIPSIIILISYRIIIIGSNDINNSVVRKNRIRLLSILIIAFLICWTPYNIIRFLRIIGQHYNSNEFSAGCNLIFVALTFLNSCFNPIIYSFINLDLGYYERSLKSNSE